MRIYTSENDPLDFCRRCFPKLEEAFIVYANLGDGPDDRGNCFSYNDEHPDYDGENYKCTKCGKKLTGGDNYLKVTTEIIGPENDAEFQKLWEKYVGLDKQNNIRSEGEDTEETQPFPDTDHSKLSKP